MSTWPHHHPDHHAGEVEPEAFWVCFLRALVGRGLADVRLAVSNHHDGLEKAIARILGSPWQRCSVRFVATCRATAGATSAAWSRRRCARSSTPRASNRPRHASETVLERCRDPLPRVAELLEAAEDALLAFYRFPDPHWSKLRSTNPLERLNKEIGRRSDVVGIFPNDASAIRLTGALLIEQNDESLVARRYLSDESLALVLDDQGDQDREEAKQLQAA